MNVLRQYEVDMNNKKVMVGDKMIISLNGFGEFVATAQQVIDDKIIFMFDECVAVRQMNTEYTNNGGYAQSDLYEWINNELINAFPDDVKNKITSISIPTYGQIFGHDDWYEQMLTTDDDNQFSLTQIRKNRIADYNNDYEYYWLQNNTLERVAASYFAIVSGDGYATYSGASASSGVRPVFILSI